VLHLAACTPGVRADITPTPPSRQPQPRSNRAGAKVVVWAELLPGRPAGDAMEVDGEEGSPVARLAQPLERAKPLQLVARSHISTAPIIRVHVRNAEGHPVTEWSNATPDVPEWVAAAAGGRWCGLARR
jgi:hypothetical protein